MLHNLQSFSYSFTYKYKWNQTVFRTAEYKYFKNNMFTYRNRENLYWIEVNLFYSYIVIYIKISSTRTLWVINFIMKAFKPNSFYLFWNIRSSHRVEVNTPFSLFISYFFFLIFVVVDFERLLTAWAKYLVSIDKWRLVWKRDEPLHIIWNRSMNSEHSLVGSTE